MMVIHQIDAIFCVRHVVSYGCLDGEHVASLLLAPLGPDS